MKTTASSIGLSDPSWKCSAQAPTKTTAAIVAVSSIPAAA